MVLGNIGKEVRSIHKLVNSMAFHWILVWHCLVAVGPWFDPCHGSHSGKMDTPKAYPKWWTWFLVETTFFFDIFGSNTKETKQPHPSYSIIFDHICILSLFIPSQMSCFIMFHRRSYFEPQPEVCTEEPFFFFGCWLGTVSTRSTRCEYKLVRRFVVYRCLVIERPPVLAKVWICLGSWIAVIRQDWSYVIHLDPTCD